MLCDIKTVLDLKTICGEKKSESDLDQERQLAELTRNMIRWLLKVKN